LTRHALGRFPSRDWVLFLRHFVVTIEGPNRLLDGKTPGLREEGGVDDYHRSGPFTRRVPAIPPPRDKVGDECVSPFVYVLFWLFAERPDQRRHCDKLVLYI